MVNLQMSKLWDILEEREKLNKEELESIRSDMFLEGSVYSIANVVVGMMQAEVDRWNGIDSVLVDYATAVSHGGAIPEKEEGDGDEAAVKLLGEDIEMPQPADNAGGDGEEKVVLLGDLAVKRALAKLDGSVEQTMAMIASAKEKRDQIAVKVGEELELDGEKSDAMKGWESEMNVVFSSEQEVLESRIGCLRDYGKSMIETFVSATRTMYAKLEESEKARTENEGAVLEALRSMAVAAIGTFLLGQSGPDLRQTDLATPRRSTPLHCTPDAEKPIEFLADIVQVEHERWSCGREELVINEATRLIAKASPPTEPKVEAKSDIRLSVLKGALAGGPKSLAELQSILVRLSAAGFLPSSWTGTSVPDKVFATFAELEDEKTGMVSEASIAEMCEKIANEE